MSCQEWETLLSGHLDRELTQQQEQQVRLHLENCELCRMTLDDMRKLQSATGGLGAAAPSDHDWKMTEKRMLSRLSRNIGWVVLCSWLIVICAYALFEFATSAEPLTEKVLVFGVIAGFSLLFLSVLSDRLQESQRDRYRDVQR